MHPTDVEAGVTLASRYLFERLLEQVPSSGSFVDDGTHRGPTAAVAQTWYAVDSVLSRPVILHVLAEDDPRSSRLLGAARRAATANDVRFLRVLDAAQEGGVCYVVKEWVAGRTLTEVLQVGPLPAQPAGWLAREVAEAVTSVHSQGGAHLRLEPDKIILTDSGTVRIDGLVIDAVLNGAPQVGTAEDAARVDTIGLGLLLYAALTARWPGENRAGLRAAPRAPDGTMLSPRQCRAGVPRILDAITDRILSKQPRTGAPLMTPLEVAAALTDAVGETPPDGILPSASSARNDSAAQRPGPNGQPESAGAAEVTAPIRQPSYQSDPHQTDPAIAGPAAAGPERPNGPAVQTETPSILAGVGGSAGSGPRDAGRHQDETRTPRWRRLVGILVAVVCLGGISLLGWQLAFQALDDGPQADPPTNEEEASPANSPSPTEESAEPTPDEPYAIGAAGDFDPQGDGEEHPEEIATVFDDDPQTMWITMEYYNYPELGLLKDGVGVWVDLGETREVGNVEALLRAGGTDLELRAAPEGAEEPPASVDGWDVLDQAQGAGGEVTFELDEPVSTRFLLLWLTKLPPSENGFRGGISEVIVSR